MADQQTDLPSRMEEFLEIERGTEKEDSTLDEYRSGLELFAEWVDTENLALDEVTPRDIKRYLTHLKDSKDYAHNTVRVKFAAVSQFYDDMVDAQDIEANPTDRVDLAEYAPKVTKVEEQEKEQLVFLSKEEFNELVRSAAPPRLRNRLLIMLQYYTAVRRQELADIRLKDLDREERQIQVRGKGDKIHTAHYQPRVDGLLARWIEGIGEGSGRPHTRYADESPYLFPTDYSEQIGGSTINDVVVEAAENAGIQEVLFTDAAGSNHYRVTSHTLRHSFAMHYLQEGGSIEGLSKLLAHSSVVVTEIYGEILDERAGREYEEFAPDPLADTDFTL